MTSMVQRRFPALRLLLTTSAPATEAMEALCATLTAAGEVNSRGADEIAFRLLTDGTPSPSSRLRVVSSVAGCNIHVRIADEALWRLLHWTLLGIAIVGVASSMYFHVLLPIAIVAVVTLCFSMLLMWSIGERTLSIIRAALKDIEDGECVPPTDAFRP